MSDLASCLEFALDALQASGAIALRYFRQPLQVEDKGLAQGGPFDPVTRADRELEQFLRERITAAFPEHGIAGEEFPEKPGASEFRWVIDPIDGTRSFMSGFPAWGSLLALTQGGEPVLGFMHQPFIGETFYGDGERAWLRREGKDRLLAVSDTRALSAATLYCTHPGVFNRAGRRRFERMAEATKQHRFGGDCYIYCLLALGLVDLTIEDRLNPHDILPMIPIVKGAGGCVTDQHGGSPNQGGMVIAAATPALHQAALEYMNPGG